MNLKSLLTKDFLTEQYLELKKSAYTIARETGVSPSAVQRYLEIHEIPRRATRTREDIAGHRYGKLVAIRMEETKSCERTKWLCECDCGNERIASITKLKSGEVACCGCQYLGIGHFAYKGTSLISGTFWSRLRRSAEVRGISLDVTIEEAERRLVLQNRRCVYLGCEISADLRHGESCTGSIDRINSSRGYAYDNIQWVHKDVNRMKWEFGEDYFLALCHAIAKKTAYRELDWNTSA